MQDFSIKPCPSFRSLNGSAKSSTTDALPKKPAPFTRQTSVDGGLLRNTGRFVATATRRLLAGREDPALRQANAEAQWWREQAMVLQASLAPPLAASPSTASSSASELAQPQRSFAWASPFSPTPSSSSMSQSPMVSPVAFGTQAQAQARARAHANVNGHAPEEILREWRMANPGQWHMEPNNRGVLRAFL